MAPHTGSATPEQIDALLNFLDEHRDLARGRLRSVEAKVEAKRLWVELCNTLNSLGGCIKTVQQWQKVWFDRKHLAKKAAADARRLALVTGGGPSMVPPLSQWELKVLSIMGDGFGERQTSARVPAFVEDEPIPSTSSQPQPSFPQPPSFDSPEREMEYGEPSGPTQTIQLPQPASPPPVSQGSSTSRHSSNPARSRRQSATGSDVRSRFFRLENDRAEREMVLNTEVAGIRAVLLQLYELLRHYVNRDE